jgi:hypothetical protein
MGPGQAHMAPPTAVQMQPGFYMQQPGYQQQGYPIQQPVPVQQQAAVLVVNAPIVSFGEVPMQTTCPSCHNTVLSTVSYQIGLLTWLIFGVLCLMGYVC